MTEFDPSRDPFAALAQLARSAAEAPVAPAVQRAGRDALIAAAERGGTVAVATASAAGGREEDRERRPEIEGVMHEEPHREWCRGRCTRRAGSRPGRGPVECYPLVAPGRARFR